MCNMRRRIHVSSIYYVRSHLHSDFQNLCMAPWKAKDEQGAEDTCEEEDTCGEEDTWPHGKPEASREPSLFPFLGRDCVCTVQD